MHLIDFLFLDFKPQLLLNGASPSNTNSKGEPLLYVKLSKALYGLLQSALLYYKQLVKELKVYGFVINPYDPCVANMLVNGSQMMVTWHVDDIKVSHKNPH